MPELRYVDQTKATMFIGDYWRVIQYVLYMFWDVVLVGAYYHAKFRTRQWIFVWISFWTFWR